MKLSYIFITFLAVSSVALADVLLKQSAVSEKGLSVVRSPWVWAGVGLYLVQIILFTYLFQQRAPLSYVGVLQTVIYAGIVLVASFSIFHEHLTPLQGAGMVIALAGVILMNIPK